MTKVVACNCDRCGRYFHSWVYKEGDNMDDLDFCPACRERRK